MSGELKSHRQEVGTGENEKHVLVPIKDFTGPCDCIKEFGGLILIYFSGLG